MRKLIIFEGCFNPVRCPYMRDIPVRPHLIHTCMNPKLEKVHEGNQVPENSFPEWCPLAKIIEK